MSAIRRARRTQLGSRLRRPSAAVRARALDEQHRDPDQRHRRRRRSASGGSGPRASRPGRRSGARCRRAGSRSARTRRRRRSGRRRAARTSRRVMRTAVALGRSSGSTIARKPALKMPNRPDEDEVVGGVRERPLVAALVDVQRDVPVHPEDGDAAASRSRSRSGARPSRAARRRARRSRPPGRAAPTRPAAVAQAEHEQGAGHDDRAGGRDHDLAERGAAGGRAAPSCAAAAAGMARTPGQQPAGGEELSSGWSWGAPLPVAPGAIDYVD